MHFTMTHVAHLVNFILVLVLTYLAVNFVANDGKQLFAACLVFAAMVPLIGSAAVQLKRDWQQARRQARISTQMHSMS